MEDINTLKQQLEQKEDEIFELLAERLTVQAEAKQQLEVAGQEHAQQIRSLQEQLRRLQQEANMANSKIVQLQKKLAENDSNNNNKNQPTQQPDHHQQQLQQELQLVTPTNANNLEPTVSPQGGAKSLLRLMQLVMLLPQEHQQIEQHQQQDLLLLLMRDKGEAIDFLWFLMERYVRHHKRMSNNAATAVVIAATSTHLVGVLRLLHTALCLVDETTRCRLVQICSSSNCSGGEGRESLRPESNNNENNNNKVVPERIRGVDLKLLRAARVRLLDPLGTTTSASSSYDPSANNIPSPYHHETAQYFRKQLFKDMKQCEKQQQQQQQQENKHELALAAILVIHELVTHINFSEAQGKQWWADFGEQDVITVWCKQAKLLIPGKPRRICTVADLERCGKNNVNDENYENDQDTSGKEATNINEIRNDVLMRSVEWLTASLDLIKFFWEHHPLPEKNDFWFHVDSQNAKRMTTAILDSLEYFFLPRMDQICDSDNVKSEMWSFLASCISWLASLLHNDQSILLLCTQMATTKTSATTWHRGMSATGILVTILHKLVMVQHKADHLLSTIKQTIPLNPYRDMIIRYLHGLLMAVQSHRRWAEKKGQDPKILESFSGLLWECRDLYLGASALLLAANPLSSACRVSDEIRALLRLQMEELTLDETEQDEDMADDETAQST